MSGFDPRAFQVARCSDWGRDLRLFGRLASTQDAAREAAESGAAEGCVILAEEQDAGRGRWGRRWEGAAGSSLLFTALIAADVPASGSLPLALGLATVLALRKLGLATAQVKWPNDIWWGGRKLGGLLVESSGRWMLAGCGLNVLQGDGAWAPGLRGQAASLRQAGLKASREEILAAVLESWEQVLGRWRRGGFEALAADWEACDALKGRLCRLSVGKETLEGRVLGAAADGALRLELAGGEERRLHGAQAMDLRPAGPD